MSVGDFVGLMEPITFLYSRVVRLLERTGKRPININNISGAIISFKCVTLYLSNIWFENCNIDGTELLSIPLAASKKSITGKWLKVDPPTIEDWIDTVHEIYIRNSSHFPLK